MKKLTRNFITILIIIGAVIVICCACVKTDPCAAGHTWELTSTTATCLESGVETYTCSVCGETKTETVSAYGHDLVQSSYTAPTCKTNGEQVDKCSRCGFESKTTLLIVDHDYQVKSTTPSTCTTKGSQLLECSMCHETKTEDLPLKDHDYELISTTPSSCTVKGSKTFKCKVCSNSYNEDIELLDHDYEVINHTPSTCIEQGTTQYKCKNCTSTYIERLDLAEHKYETQTVEATCFTHGGTVEKCSVCQYQKPVNETHLLTHDFGADGYCAHCGIYETLFDVDKLNVFSRGTSVNTIDGSLIPKFNNDNTIPDIYWQDHTVTLSISMYDLDKKFLEEHSFISATIPHTGANYGKLTIQYMDTTGTIYNGSPNGFVIFTNEGDLFSPESRTNCVIIKIKLSCDGYKSIEKSYIISNS